MRYTPDELEGLRQSPLVKKPDGLPSILQWMDVPAEQNNNNNNHTTNNGTARRTRGRDGEAATTEHRTDRPLINPMGQFGRRQSMQPGEETVLGPPKLNFTSAARAAKNTSDKQERTGITSADGDQLGDRFPRDKNERWSRDGDRDRNRERGITNGRRGAREDGEGWTSVKGRKSLGQEDFERFNRNGDRAERSERNREKTEGALEDDAPPRRGQRDRADRAERWGRRDDAKEEAPKFGVQGGWRERTQQPQREQRERGDRNDRDWERGGGGNRGEEDPEWMDAKVEKKKEPQMKTQADFERWKEQMKAKDTPVEERGAPKESPATPATATGIAAGPMFTAPVQTPTTAESTQGILFGNWGNVKGVELGQDESIKAKPKPAKASKFMSMFAKPEEPAAHSPIPISAPAPPVPHANEDQQGFQRILQMLGQVNVGSPQAAPPNQPSPPNGIRGHGGGISLDFQQSPPPDMQNHRPPPHRTLEQQSILQNILAPRPTAPESRPSQQARFNAMSPENALQEQFGPPRPDSGRQDGQSPFQNPPSRNANPQDANLAAILNSRAREDSQRDQGQKQRERDFLLTLMQQPRNTPPQMMNQNMPRGGPPMAMFENMQHEQRAPPQPKARGGLPPGFMDDPRMFDNEMMRQEAQRREQELRQLSIQQQQQQQQQDLRNKNPRLPMGFPGHEDPTLGLQRRNTAGEIPRQMTNMGIPSQQHPDMPFMGGRGQPGMPPTPQDRPNIAPPPGFGGPMRQPPGFGGPNPQQQMGPGGPSFSAGNTPLGAHPPGLPQLGGGSMRGMPPGFPGGPGGNGMQGPPQGYFPPPPGYGPPPPGMRGEDPRMMFDGQFGGPPRQQQGRPGPPNMY
ncbi:hypothetical protein C7974DRAFT_73849 [Boeremia exigua]|uniref:uncharacterized protein n=1 Tax=Boeremia exigua TaxID=749465 RepID=UPI001E8CCB5B|nr:uncharacterized protein C7974DRAFT_73849 [Boeremia exigua]KAH6614269.1 hypothetical protein C7974DRAFT_73849 [Boeremia exigua]